MVVRSDEDWVRTFLKSGKYCNVESFERIDRKSWRYRCSICSYDEYAKRGLCSGYFVSSQNHLREGKMSCRCSKLYRWTKEQSEFHISRLLVDKPNFSFVRWKPVYKNNRSRAEFRCNKHGVFDTELSSIRQRGVCCRKCGREFIRDNYYLSESDAEAIIKDFILDKGYDYEFVGWVNNFKNLDSQIILNCPRHKQWTPRMTYLIKGGHKCPGCAVYGYKKYG